MSFTKGPCYIYEHKRPSALNAINPQCLRPIYEKRLGIARRFCVYFWDPSLTNLGPPSSGKGVAKEWFLRA